MKNYFSSDKGLAALLLFLLILVWFLDAVLMGAYCYAMYLGVNDRYTTVTAVLHLSFAAMIIGLFYGGYRRVAGRLKAKRDTGSIK